MQKSTESVLAEFYLFQNVITKCIKESNVTFPDRLRIRIANNEQLTKDIKRAYWLFIYAHTHPHTHTKVSRKANTIMHFCF